MTETRDFIWNVARDFITENGTAFSHKSGREINSPLDILRVSATIEEIKR